MNAESVTTAVWEDLSIAVPVYSRPAELRQLLESIALMTVLPGEVVLCEDGSPERQLIASIATEWKNVLGSRGCVLLYFENPQNLGYDGNVRKLFSVSTRKWVLLLGNDDAMLCHAIPFIQSFVAANPAIRMISRTFVRFMRSIDDVMGLTQLSAVDRVYCKDSDEAGTMLRLCGFVGGLVVDRQWAAELATNRYDGTLYYQIYLAAEAFAASGIGYIASPLVGSRAGNPPLFGSAAAEKAAHVPGAYSAEARASMWRGVLRICADVEKETSVPLVKSVRRELAGRQSFHVFELVTVQGRSSTLRLVSEFNRLGLMGHVIPLSLSALGLILGQKISWFFHLIRSAQNWRDRRRLSVPLVRL